MIELYISVAVLIAGVLVYAQVLIAKNKLLKAENEILNQSIKEAKIALSQREKSDFERFKVQHGNNARHRSEQAEIDQGKRNQFEEDSL